MNVLWHKVWFDLWHHKGRTLLVVLSIAAGVFAIGGIFGMVDRLLVTMDEAHRSVSPSHINIILRNFVTQDVIDDLKDTPGVLDIDPANQLSVRYRTSPDQAWEIGTLVMRPDYDAQIYDVLELKEGQWPLNGSLGVERLSSQFYQVGIGDQVEFQIDGEARSFPVEGMIRHPFVQPPPFGGQANFFTDSEGLAEFGLPEGLFGQLLVQVENYTLERAQEIAGDLRAQLGDQRVGVVVTLYQDPERHWGRQFVEGVDLILKIMAVVSLLMSVILVLTTSTALITQQTDQIGVIKAIGGRSGLILRLFMSGVLIYGLLALIIAAPLADLFAFQMNRWFLNLFNIDYNVYGVSREALALQVLAALVAPALAALWPVLRGANLTVREAIASYGLGADFGSNRFDRLIDRVGEKLLSSPYALALGNLFRRKERLLLTLAALTAAGVMFLVLMSLNSSTNLTLDNDAARRGYDVRIGFTRDHPVSQIEEIAAGIDGVEEVEVWYARNATILREGERLEDSAGLGAQLTGIPAGTEMYRPIITAGRWLEPADDTAASEGQGGRVIVISQDTATKNGIAVGDIMVLDLGELPSVEWEVVGTYKVVVGGAFITEAIYAPLAAMTAALGQEDAQTGSQVLVRGSSDRRSLAGATIVSNDLEAAYEAQDMDVDFYTSGIKLQEREYATNQFNTVVSMLAGLAALIATVGGIGLAGSLGISVMERTREIGVMRAIGARSGTIMSLFVMEGLLQGILSWLLALPISLLVAPPLARLLGQTMIDIDLDFAYDTTAIFIWLGIVLGIAVMASLGPARDATKISVRQSLAYA